MFKLVLALASVGSKTGFSASRMCKRRFLNEKTKRSRCNAAEMRTRLSPHEKNLVDGITFFFFAIFRLTFDRSLRDSLGARFVLELSYGSCVFFYVLICAIRSRPSSSTFPSRRASSGVTLRSSSSRLGAYDVPGDVFSNVFLGNVKRIFQYFKYML